MARKRIISPEFWTDEKVGLMPLEARLLFMGLISNADDEGRLPGNVLLIKSMVFPYDAFSIKKIEEWINLLCEQKIIVRYAANSQTYIQVVNFLKHQTINRPTPSKIPPINNDVLQFIDDSLTTHEQLIDNSLPIEKKRIEKKRRERNISEYTPEFDKWYSEYPRPQAKQDSFKNFEKVRKDRGLDFVLQCTRNYIDYYNSLPEKDKGYPYSSNNFFGQKGYYRDFEIPKVYKDKGNSIDDLGDLVPGALDRTPI